MNFGDFPSIHLHLLMRINTHTGVDNTVLVLDQTKVVALPLSRYLHLD
ncbi:hypothetical protein NNX28_16490 [Arthrobacter sp. zg-Y859]|uniref:Uncharacterized protein n=1 Tax=Arthrobacter jinronghuae TaxID=2964609 RepID=A0ABT1NYC8_9MICC|nr:hypothetical protein [Arthrobacter jinronghuae]MCQ1951519.1 hypothetical protein [Arthrobacter jinronghuae]UWX79597.1 hypothetical protein N2K98_05180 [Arthrobacter jinronghuae]